MSSWEANVNPKKIPRPQGRGANAARGYEGMILIIIMRAALRKTIKKVKVLLFPVRYFFLMEKRAI